jgi:uncharacterized protein (DUF433 family)
MAEPRIISDPKIMTGKPVIEGTRITVELILTRLGEGRSVSDIVEEYPHLSRAQVEAAIAYARKLAAQPSHAAE